VHQPDIVFFVVFWGPIAVESIARTDFDLPSMHDHFGDDIGPVLRESRPMEAVAAFEIIQGDAIVHHPLRDWASDHKAGFEIGHDFGDIVAVSFVLLIVQSAEDVSRDKVPVLR
jgi:hypothetical protein